MATKKRKKKLRQNGRFELRINDDRKTRFETMAMEKGLTLAGYILLALDEQYRRDVQTMPPQPLIAPRRPKPEAEDVCPKCGDTKGGLLLSGRDGLKCDQCDYKASFK
uniref:Uncharacterized protein n=1 Tax=viral metagenome TaxID=1070528 RepID=A0A6M3LSZ9_9ZZZZ